MTQYGHDIGDKVLIEMARRLSSSIRHSDVLVRWGGEEFLIVSRYTDRTRGRIAGTARSVRDRRHPVQFRRRRSRSFRTCSVGMGRVSLVSRESRER